MLSSADDWQLVVDLEIRLRFPRHIAETSLRPDMVLYSDSKKQCIIWELTVSWEEHMIIANVRKRSKYQELVEQCEHKAWRINYDPIKVGCRGFAGQSLCKALAKIGILGAARSRALKEISANVLNGYGLRDRSRGKGGKITENIHAGRKSSLPGDEVLFWIYIYIYIYIYI